MGKFISKIWGAVTDGRVAAGGGAGWLYGLLGSDPLDTIWAFIKPLILTALGG